VIYRPESRPLRDAEFVRVNPVHVFTPSLLEVQFFSFLTLLSFLRFSNKSGKGVQTVASRSCVLVDALTPVYHRLHFRPGAYRVYETASHRRHLGCLRGVEFGNQPAHCCKTSLSTVFPFIVLMDGCVLEGFHVMHCII
jgi:hypothetical protein